MSVCNFLTWRPRCTCWLVSGPVPAFTCEKARLPIDADSRQTLYFSVMLQIALLYTEAMPNFGACCAHDHDCEAADCGPAWSLHEHIDQSHVCHISVAMKCPTKACLYDPASACVDGHFLLLIPQSSLAAFKAARAGV